MSYEGYEQHLCVLGHLYETDCYATTGDTCDVCGAISIWSNSVDTTNGNSEGIILDWSSLEIGPGPKTNNPRAKTYRIPTAEELEKLRGSLKCVSGDKVITPENTGANIEGIVGKTMSNALGTFKTRKKVFEDFAECNRWLAEQTFDTFDGLTPNAAKVLIEKVFNAILVAQGVNPLPRGCCASCVIEEGCQLQGRQGRVALLNSCSDYLPARITLNLTKEEANSPLAITTKVVEALKAEKASTEKIEQFLEEAWSKTGSSRLAHILNVTQWLATIVIE